MNYSFDFRVTAAEKLCWTLTRWKIDRGSGKSFWTDCFRWPQGPAETIQIALNIEKSLRNTQFCLEEASLGWLAEKVG